MKNNYDMSTFIIVGQFGESFEFGGAIGDSSLSRSSTFNFLDIPFPFYERQERILFVCVYYLNRIIWLWDSIHMYIGQ